MRLRTKFILALIVLLLLAVAAVFEGTLRESAQSEVEALLAETTLARLPDNSKTAQQELKKVRKELAKFVPKDRYIVINTHSNLLSYRGLDSVYMEGVCSTGSGGELADSASGRSWTFGTPHGVFKVDSRLKEPWWRKPDWAFIEEDEKIPKDERERYDPAMMGEYALGFGDGYFIHGTIYERLLGINVTHGCVRLGTDDLRWLWDRAKIGTRVYVF